MSLGRSHPWRTFLLAAFAINAICFALVRLIPRPQVEFGAALDVALTVPLLYLLLIVRAGLAPPSSAVPLFLLGLLRAGYLDPRIAFTRPAVAAAAEIAIGSLLVLRVRRGLRQAPSGDVLERIERASRELIPSDRAAAILAGELAVFWYAFTSWRSSPEIPAGARAFTIHRRSGVATLFGFLAGIGVMETAGVHLIVTRWNPTAAWILTGLGIYGTIWLAAVARSFPLRPVIVTRDAVIVRAGLIWTVRIPRASVSLEPAGVSCDLRAPVIAHPNVVLRLAAPVIARGPYGISRRVSTISLALDDAAGFAELNW